MSTITTNNKIEGFKTFIDKQGRQVSASEATQQALADGSVRERFNGPHTDSAWARNLLGTPTQSQVRRTNLALRESFNTFQTNTV